MKICVYAVADRSPAESYRVHIRDEWLPRLLASNSEISHCTVNLIAEDLTGGLPGAKMSAEDIDAGPTYDVVVEYWLDAPASRTRNLIDSLLSMPGKLDASWVEPFMAKDTAVARSEPALLRLISPCRPKVGMPIPQVFQYWNEHVERANRIHVGMSRYVRNWNMAPLTPNAPAYFGTPMLSFQTMEDWTDHFYSDEAGAAEIAADVGTFVDNFVPLLTREFRIK